MRSAVVLLSTLAVVLAATCGQTPVKPDLSYVNTAKASGRFGRYIAGGDVAVPYSWPWMVALCTKNWVHEDQYPLECGATVIAPGWVMTTAQCVFEDSNPQNYKLKAGIFDGPESDENAEQILTVKALHIHPQFDHKRFTYDVALLELATPLTYSDHVQPVCLPKTDNVATAYPNDLWITGWGSTEDEGDISQELRQADVPIINLTTCKQQIAMLRPEIMFCAGGKGNDPCMADDGIPIVKADSTGTWFQYGMASYGRACGADGEAGVYARVSAFCGWINSTTNGTAQCQDVK